MTRIKNAPPHTGAAHRGPASPASATVGTITMRVGGKYLLRNGAEVRCRARHEKEFRQYGVEKVDRHVFFTGPLGSGLSWNEKGRYCAVDVESDFDVVAEIESDGRT